MRIAVIGTGISGMLAARLLHESHEVHLFEANDYLGGHTNTIKVEVFGRSYYLDTGFMVFNHRTYPNFIRMLRLLDVADQDSDMSFSVRCLRTGLEYQGSSLGGLFAQRRNLLRPAFYRMLLDVLRFNRRALELVDHEDETVSLGMSSQVRQPPPAARARHDGGRSSRTVRRRCDGRSRRPDTQYAHRRN